MVVQVEQFVQLLETFVEAKVPFVRFTDASQKQISKLKLFERVEISFTMRKIKI